MEDIVEMVKGHQSQPHASLAGGTAHPHFTFFNVFSYLTFRAILSIITGLVVALWMGPRLIRRLQIMKFGQVIRNDGPESHLSKEGHPDHGRPDDHCAIFHFCAALGRLDNPYVWLVLFVLGPMAPSVLPMTISGGAQEHRRPHRRWKYFWQSRSRWVWRCSLRHGHPRWPDPAGGPLPQVMPQLGLMFILLTYFVIVGTSNAVNLTDGLDGLAIMPTVMVAGASPDRLGDRQRQLCRTTCTFPTCPTPELVIVCTAIVGAGLGFLWFNTYPAQVFMGTSGSLALAARSVPSVIVRQEFLLVIMGGLRDGDRLGDPAGRILQTAAACGSSAWPPSITTIREEGLAGAARHRALLDHHPHAGAAWPRHLKVR